MQARCRQDRKNSRCPGSRQIIPLGTTTAVRARSRSVISRASSSRPIWAQQAARKRYVGTQLGESCSDISSDFLASSKRRAKKYATPILGWFVALSRLSRWCISKSWIARYQTDGGVDILAKGRRYVSAAGENAGIFTGHPKRPPRQVETVATLRLRITALAAEANIHMATRCQSEGRSKMGVGLDRLL
jgi:hypothetical protein